MTDDNDPFHDADDMALDRLLASAEWPTPDATAVRRLTRTVADERRRRLPWALPAAVAAAVAVGGVCWVAWQGSRPTNAIPPVIAERGPTAGTPDTPVRRDEVVAAVPQPAGRAPTVSEQMLMIAATKRTPSKQLPQFDSTPPMRAARVINRDDRTAVLRAAREMLARPVRPSAAADETSLAARLAAVATPADWPLVRAFIDRSQTRLATLAALAARQDDAAVDLLLRGVLDPSLRPAVLASVKTSGLPVAALLNKFDAPRMDERWAAAVTLGRTADGDTLDRLAAMAERGEHRRESIAALIASDTPAARSLLARVANTREAAPHVAPAREAIAVLLSRDTIHPCFPACGS